MIRTPSRLIRLLLVCGVASTVALSVSAQTAAKKKAIHGELIDGPAPADPAAPTTVPVVLAKPAPAPLAPDAAQPVEFTKLASYEYVVPDLPNTNQVRGSDIADKQIPSEIKALDHKKVSVVGYLMPLREQDGKSTEFLLMRTQSSCCYGIAPSITELITVKAAGKGVPTVMDQLVEIEGTLKVGTVREDGYIVGVYQMDEGKFIGRSDR